MKKQWKARRGHYAKCNHHYCSDCKTKRGRKRGIRYDRHVTRAALHQLVAR